MSRPRAGTSRSTVSSGSENWSGVRKKMKIGAIIESDDNTSGEENVQEAGTSFDISDYINQKAAEKLDKFNQKQKARNKSDSPRKGRAHNETDEDLEDDDEEILSTDSSSEDGDNGNAEINDHRTSKTTEAEETTARQRRWSLRSVLPRAALPAELKKPLKPPPSKKRKQENAREKEMTEPTEVPVNNGDQQSQLISSTPIRPNKVNEPIGISPVPGVAGERSQKLILTQKSQNTRQATRLSAKTNQPSSAPPVLSPSQISPPALVSSQGSQRSTTGQHNETDENRPEDIEDDDEEIFSTDSNSENSDNENAEINDNGNSKTREAETTAKHPRKSLRSVVPRAALPAEEPKKPPPSKNRKQENAREKEMTEPTEVPVNNGDQQSQSIPSTPIRLNMVNEPIANGTGSVQGVAGESSKQNTRQATRSSAKTKQSSSAPPVLSLSQISRPAVVSSQGSQRSTTGQHNETDENRPEDIEDDDEEIFSTDSNSENGDNENAEINDNGKSKTRNAETTAKHPRKSLRSVVPRAALPAEEPKKPLKPPPSKKRKHETAREKEMTEPTEVPVTNGDQQSQSISSTPIRLNKVNEPIAIGISPVPGIAGESSQKLILTQKSKNTRQATRLSAKSKQSSSAPVLSSSSSQIIPPSTPIRLNKENEPIANGTDPVQGVAGESSEKVILTPRQAARSSAKTKQSSSSPTPVLSPSQISRPAVVSSQGSQRSTTGQHNETDENRPEDIEDDGEGIFSTDSSSEDGDNENAEINDNGNSKTREAETTAKHPRKSLRSVVPRAALPAEEPKKPLKPPPSKKRKQENAREKEMTEPTEVPVNNGDQQSQSISSTPIRLNKVNEPIAIGISPVPGIAGESSQKLFLTQKSKNTRQATRSSAKTNQPSSAPPVLSSSQISPPALVSSQGSQRSTTGQNNETDENRPEDIEDDDQEIFSTVSSSEDSDNENAEINDNGKSKTRNAETTAKHPRKSLRSVVPRAALPAEEPKKPLKPPPSKKRKQENAREKEMTEPTEVPVNNVDQQSQSIPSTPIRLNVPIANATDPVQGVAGESSEKVILTQKTRQAARSSAKTNQPSSAPPVLSSSQISRPALVSSQGSQRSTTGRRRSIFQMAREKTSKSKTQSKKREKTPERYVGNDPFGNYHMLKLKEVRKILREEKPDVRLDDAAMRTFTLKVNHYLEDFFVHFCEKTDQPLGFIPFDMLLSSLKSENLLPGNADAEYLLKTMKKDLSKEDWNRSEGILIPSRFSKTDNNADYLFK